MWLATKLRQRKHVHIELPRYYNSAHREAMRADASHMDLRAFSDYYFDLGVELAQM